MRQAGPDQQEGGGDHEPLDQLPLLVRVLLDGGDELDACVVDQDIDLEVQLDQRRRVGQVEPPGLTPATSGTDLLGRRVHCLLIDVGDRDPGSVPGQSLSGGTTQAAPTPGHQRMPADQVATG